MDRSKESAHHEWAEIELRLNCAEKRMESMERKIDTNTTIISEVRELMEVGRLGLRVLGWMGVLVKWLGTIAAAAMAIYAAIAAITHGGDVPK